ncbi:MMPL family transporter [Streptomyces californicus]
MFTVLVGRADGEALTGADKKAVASVAELGGRRVDAGPAGHPEHERRPDPLPRHGLLAHPEVHVSMTAPDRAFTLLSVRLEGNTVDPGMHNLFRAFREHAEDAFAEVRLRTGFTGGLADQVDTRDAEEPTQRIVGMLMLGLIVLVNVLVFRSLCARLIPLLAVTVVGGAATGVIVGGALLTGTWLDQ